MLWYEYVTYSLRNGLGLGCGLGPFEELARSSKALYRTCMGRLHHSTYHVHSRRESDRWDDASKVILACFWILSVSHAGTEKPCIIAMALSDEYLREPTVH